MAPNKLFRQLSGSLECVKPFAFFTNIFSELAVQLGVSQTLLEAAITQPRPVFSCFVNLLQSEEARKQIILVIDGPAA